MKGKKTIFVMDTIWKLVNQNNSISKDKYGLSQSNFCQLYAYGQKYLGGHGEMLLIYPVWKKFNCEIEPFYFDEALKLTVVPYDLRSEQLLLREPVMEFNRNCSTVIKSIIRTNRQ